MMASKFNTNIYVNAVEEYTYFKNLVLKYFENVVLNVKFFFLKQLYMPKVQIGNW